MKYVIHGSDTEQIAWQARRIFDSEKADVTSRFDAKSDDPYEILSSMDSLSLFVQKELVIIDNASFLGAKNTSKLKLEDVLQHMDTDHTIVFLCPGFKPDSRKKAVKSILEKCEVIECKPLDEKSQPQWIDAQIKARKIPIEKDAKDWLVKHGGLNMAKLDKDLEVLELFGAKITLEDIKALVTPELNTNVFKMTDALFEKNAGDLLYYFRLFRQQNMEVPAIIGLLSSQIRFTYQVKVLAENRVPKSEMESMLNASSGRIWHTQQKAARFRTDELLGHLSRLHQLDLAYKSGQIDQDLGFEKFVIDMLIQNNPL